MGKEIDREQHSLLRSDWRAYLKQGVGTSDSERKLRERIRDRVVTGLYDCSIINQYARNDDIKQMFERLSNDGTENAEQSELVNGESRNLPETHFTAARAMVSLAWRGLRLNGLDKEEIFEKVIVRGVEDAEADYKGVPHGRVESDMKLNKLEPVTETGIDPVEKWERGISLSGDDLREISDRLNDHPDVETIVGEDIGDLIDQHLVDD